MLLDGVAPDWTTFEEAMWANMRSRRVADTVYFFTQMGRRGFEPTVWSESSIVWNFGSVTAPPICKQSSCQSRVCRVN